MSNKMLILAGGFGTRLSGLVNKVPKPLAPINGVPLLKIQIDHWVKQGQKNFIFLLHYKAEQIIEFLIKQSVNLGDGIVIDWVIEREPLERAVRF